MQPWKQGPQAHASPRLCRTLNDMPKGERIRWNLKTWLHRNDLMKKRSWVQWLQDVLHVLDNHFGISTSSKSCEGTCEMWFQIIHIKIVRFFLKKNPNKKRLFDSCIEDFLFWFCCAVFRGPFLPHGMTNVNCTLFSKVEYFNHMLIHWQMGRILLPVLFLFYTSNAYKSQRVLRGYVRSRSHSEMELRTHKDPSGLSGLSRNSGVCAWKCDTGLGCPCVFVPNCVSMI